MRYVTLSDVASITFQQVTIETRNVLDRDLSATRDNKKTTTPDPGTLNPDPEPDSH